MNNGPRSGGFNDLIFNGQQVMLYVYLPIIKSIGYLKIKWHGTVYGERKYVNIWDYSLR